MLSSSKSFEPQQQKVENSLVDVASPTRASTHRVGMAIPSRRIVQVVFFPKASADGLPTESNAARCEPLTAISRVGSKVPTAVEVVALADLEIRSWSLLGLNLALRCRRCGGLGGWDNRCPLHEGGEKPGQDDERG